jgi:hypothetical protein
MESESLYIKKELFGSGTRCRQRGRSYHIGHDKAYTHVPDYTFHVAQKYGVVAVVTNWNTNGFPRMLTAPEVQTHSSTKFGDINLTPRAVCRPFSTSSSFFLFRDQLLRLMRSLL